MQDPSSYLQSMGITEAQFKNDIKNGIEVDDKKVEIQVMQPLLNDTGREEAKGLIKKAVANDIFKESHLKKLDSYSDTDLISYSIAYVNRTAK